VTPQDQDGLLSHGLASRFPDQIPDLARHIGADGVGDVLVPLRHVMLDQPISDMTVRSGWREDEQNGCGSVPRVVKACASRSPAFFSSAFQRR
jgi:hypothetical protein